MGQDEEGNEMSGFTEIALLQYEIKKLRAERSALRAGLREICTALDDAACDLVPTVVECIKKLKAENEWRDIETAPKDGTEFLTYCPSYANKWWISTGKCNLNGATHWMPLPKPPALDAAMAQGEK